MAFRVGQERDRGDARRGCSDRSRRGADPPKRAWPPMSSEIEDLVKRCSNRRRLGFDPFTGILSLLNGTILLAAKLPDPLVDRGEFVVYTIG